MEFAPQRARLAEIERELARLGQQHEMAISAFRFDAARDLQNRIAPLERERAALASALPPLPPPVPAAGVPWRVGRRRDRRAG